MRVETLKLRVFRVDLNKTSTEERECGILYNIASFGYVETRNKNKAVAECIDSRAV